MPISHVGTFFTVNTGSFFRGTHRAGVRVHVHRIDYKRVFMDISVYIVQLKKRSKCTLSPLDNNFVTPGCNIFRFAAGSL